jgi:hypothetical protein
MDRSRYADNYEERAQQCKEAAGWKCEACSIAHMSDGTMGSCLTTHHPDHDPENPAARLQALCARCHLAEERIFKFEQLRLEQCKAGQLDLFGQLLEFKIPWPKRGKKEGSE